MSGQNEFKCVLGSGGITAVEGLVTAGGDEPVAPLHGMGTPTLSIQRVNGGASRAFAGGTSKRWS